MTKVTTTQECNKCHEDKDIELFSWAKKSEGRRHRTCKSCVSARHRTNRYELKQKFGITPQQYEEMLERQGGVCAICKKPETVKLNGVVKRLAIDHDRNCCPDYKNCCGNCIRALLCSSCNWFVGQIEKRQELLPKVLNYLNPNKS